MPGSHAKRKATHKKALAKGAKRHAKRGNRGQPKPKRHAAAKRKTSKAFWG